jgi:hypothetical protein
MAATPLSPESERELADLRARAYGPDAARALDQREIARLTHLEDLARPSASLPLSPPEESPPAVSVAIPLAVPPSPVRQRRARVSLSASAAVVAVIGLGVGLAVPGLVSPRPHAVLGPSPGEDSVPNFALYGTVAASPTRYEPFHDLEVWSARTVEGAICVLVISADRSWRRAGCAPRPLEPMTDIFPYPVLRPIEGVDLPIGSVVRFILRENAVHVWIDENAEPS